MQERTPYYWKVCMLHSLKFGLEAAADGDPAEGAVAAAETEVASIHNLEGSLLFNGIEYPLSAHSNAKHPYSDRAYRSFLRCAEILRDDAAPDTRVQRVRESATAEADFLRRGLLPLWIRSKRWSQDDLDSAKGAKQRGRRVNEWISVARARGLTSCAAPRRTRRCAGAAPRSPGRAPPPGAAGTAGAAPGRAASR